MTQPVHLRETFYAVEVPAPDHAIIAGNTITWEKPEGNGRGFIALPPGTWKIICTSKEAKEDECAIIAGLSFQDVVHGWSRTFFHDLLASKGLDPKNILVIQKM
jgi:hypothetical protein